MSNREQRRVYPAETPRLSASEAARGPVSKGGEAVIDPTSAAPHSAARHLYRVFGLCVSSSFALDGLATAGDTQVPDVSVTLMKRDAGADLAPVFTRSRIVYEIADVATFVVTDGRDVEIHPSPERSPAEIGEYLLGPGLGLLLHQRGIFPIHASAVLVDGSVVAFAAPSGSGKSTIAARLAQRGYRLVSDDILAVNWETEGRPQVSIGPIRTKLNADSWQSVGMAEGDDGRRVSGDAKRRRYGGFADASHYYPLARVYFLVPTAEDRPAIEPLTPFVAMQLLRHNVYGDWMLARLDAEVGFLQAAARAAQVVDGFILNRPASMDTLDQFVGELERHLRA